MAPYFARFGISGSQWGILKTIARSTEQGRAGIRLTDMGERLLVRPPSITRAIDRMERMGLVKRHADARDQRVKLIRLTPAGERLVEQVMQGLEQHVDLVMGGLNQRQRQELHRLLDRLSAHLESLAIGPADGCGEE